MTDDFEESLRETLAKAVPPPPEVPGRAAGALGYTRRARRTRSALVVGVAATVAAALVVIPSVLASSDDTAAPTVKSPQTRPAMVMPPLAHPFTCRSSAIVHNESPPEQGVIPRGAVLARICPAESQFAYWTAPTEPLVTGVDELASRVNALPEVVGVWNCPVQLSSQPAYTLTFQYVDGHTVAIDGQTGGCDTVSAGQVGRAGATLLLRDYLGLLHEQRANFSPPPVAAVQPGCLSPGQLDRLQSVLVDGLGPGLTRAIACSYLFPSGPNPTGMGSLSAQQVARLNADLAAHATRQPPVRNCRALRGPPFELSIVGVNAWGDRVELAARCSVYTFLDRDATWYWTPTKQTSAMLQSVLRMVPHPNGRITGRLLAIGGPPGNPPRPLSGSVTLRGRETSTLLVRDDGTFRGQAPPGRYRVVGHSPLFGSNDAACNPLHPFITVRTHETVHVSVLCQMR